MSKHIKFTITTEVDGGDPKVRTFNIHKGWLLAALFISYGIYVWLTWPAK